VSFSPHKVRFTEPLRGARLVTGGESFVAQRVVDAQLEERFRLGFEAGQKALAEELVRQRSQLLEIQNNVLRSVERALPTVVAQCEKDLVLLALAVARRVVREMPILAETVEAMLKTGLAELQDTAEYQVRLNPDDLALLQTLQSPVLPSPSDPKVRFIADAAVPRAGCVIHTQHGAIELNREKMFQRLEEAALC
jgi:flagellar biosynthesis/type III secretory pathway protein FliH